MVRTRSSSKKMLGKERSECGDSKLKQTTIEPPRTILAFLENVPKNLREGQWSPMAYVFIILLTWLLVGNYVTAMQSYHDAAFVETPSILVQTFRLFGFIYGVLVLSALLYGAGPWPLASYTVTSWNFMTLRFLFAFLNDFYPGRIQHFLAHSTRFPALVGCTVTVTLWWALLVPLIHFYLAPSLRKGFWKFNASFLLINLHLLCLPLVALEFWLSADSLVFFDLWVGMFSAFLYMLWYLLVLDPKGLQFYIILTPRPHWCFLVYFCILFIYVAVFQFWNSLVQ